MARYRKKPVVIEAVQFTKPMLEKRGWPTWLAAANHVRIFDDQLLIETLEGNLFANVGDWIIRGVKGELYPCKNDIFEQTYDPVD